MKILVTGGTGVIGEGVVPHLLRAGHQIRILSREAGEDVRQWPQGVEAHIADIGQPAELQGAASGCDAVVHISGIAKEVPPALTFERINVEGTRAMVREAERAGVGHFIFISSLGAERGRSEYHQSKRMAEEIVREFKGDWVILRPGSVYGPGDIVISTLLQMIRTLPMIPVIDAGQQRFQPIWFDDLGLAITKAVEAADLSHVTLEVAGSDITSMNDVLDRLAVLTARNPLRVPIPAAVAALGTQFAESLGIDFPVDHQMLTMLLEDNVIQSPTPNALIGTFDITPTPLDEGLRALVDMQPEQLPGEGFGSIERKSFRADITGSRYTAEELLEIFRTRVTEIMPINFAAEPDVPRQITQGATMTAELPLRGIIQMRAEEVTEERITLATLKGHPLAGIVRFSATERSDGIIRFQILLYAQAANIADWLLMSSAGGMAQEVNWVTVVQRMIDRSGGTAPDGIESNQETLDDEEASDLEAWIRDLITVRKYEENRDATS
jgi:NADH dehydrogenase